jgi:hypothetical protein
MHSSRDHQSGFRGTDNLVVGGQSSLTGKSFQLTLFDCNAKVIRDVSNHHAVRVNHKL